MTKPLELHKLPPEMISEIACFCTHDGRKAMSQVSKEMRSHFLKHLFHAVSFHGSGEEVSKGLEEFLSRESDLAKRGGYKNIRHARIVVSRYPSQTYLTLTSQTNQEHVGGGFRDHSLSNPELPSLIIKSITHMSRLQSLTLNISGFGIRQEELFLKLIDTTEPWRIRNLTIFTNLEKSLESKIIRHCTADHPEGLSICGLHSGPTYSAAANFHKTVKKLNICVPREESLGVLEIMNPDFITKLAKDFQDLEWLALSANPDWRHQPGSVHATPADFERCLARFVKALQKVRKLKRLAFTLGRYEVSGTLPHNVSATSPNCSSLNRWFIDLTCRIGEALPQLEDLVVFRTTARTCRGTRKTNEALMTVRLVDIHQRTHAGQFPFGFEEPDKKHWRHDRKTMTK